MFMPFSVGHVRIVVLLVSTVAATCVIVRPSAAQSTAEPDPTGGLRSRGMVPGAKESGSGTSREELVRQWDIDGNGTIDPSEVSIARARMRRSRLELELDSGIDPVTGKPRILSDNEPTDTEAPGGGDELPDLPPDQGKRSSEQPAPPGTRVPEAKPAVTGSSSPGVPKVPSRPGSDPERRTTNQSPSWSRPGSVTGGVRAGAPEARPGYGSLGPKPDLNAGIPLPDTGRQSGSRILPRGGLLPSSRQPLAPRPTAPAAPTSRPPRVTADDIGGF